MAQNSARLTWAPAEVDGKLKSIMNNAYAACFDVGKQYGSEQSAKDVLPSLVVGANISGFIKVGFCLVMLLIGTMIDTICAGTGRGCHEGPR